MRRLLFTSFAFLFLLLFVGAGFAWIASYRTHDAVEWVTPHRTVAAAPLRGQIAFYTAYSPNQPYINTGLHRHERYEAYFYFEYIGRIPWKGFLPCPVAYDISRQFHGFRYHHVHFKEPWSDEPAVAGYDGLEILVPAWAVMLATFPFPALWITRRLRPRRHRKPRGVCRLCSYDLRASSQRCPECGTPILPDSGADKGKGKWAISH